MSDALNELKRLPLASALTRTQLEAFAENVQVLSLSDTRLWGAGQVPKGLGLLLDGEIAVRAGEVAIGTVKPGEVFGESAAFYGDPSKVDVYAETFAKVVLIPRAFLQAERDREVDQHDLFLRRPWRLDIFDPDYDVRPGERPRRGLYSLLLHECTLQVLARIRRTNARAAEVGVGAPRTLREPSWFQVVLGRLRSEPSADVPRPLSLLRGLPRMADAPERMLLQLADCFEPVKLHAGTVVVRQGEAGDSALLIAEGQVEVLREADSGGAELLATVGPGAFVGINAMIDATSRSATLVALTDGLAWKLPAGEMRERRWSSEMGIFWRESLLALLLDQLRKANEALQRAEQASDDSALLEALSGVEGANHAGSIAERP